MKFRHETSGCGGAVPSGARPIALILAVVAALVVVAAGAGANKPIPVNSPDLITPVVTPLGLSNKAVTVVVQLAGDPSPSSTQTTPLTKDQEEGAWQQAEG